MLLYQIESRLRDVVAALINANRRPGASPVEPEYLPRPLTPDEVEQERVQKAYDALMVQQLEDL